LRRSCPYFSGTVRLLAGLVIAIFLTRVRTAQAQDLVPGAYTPAPVGFNVVNIVSSFSKGDVTFDPALPVEDGRGTIVGGAVSIARLFSLGGRYANVGIILPLAHGRISGVLAGQHQEVTRDGMADLGVRFGVNLYGARAMTPKEFAAYRPGTIVGFSLALLMPTGQYDSTKFINISTNRWTFRPELGVSRRVNRWTFEGDLAAVMYTDNTDYVNGGVKEQAAIVAFQGHVIYTMRPGYWVAFDANFWHGGRTTVNGLASTEEQHNSRMGATFAIPIQRHQLRIAVSSGAYTRLGGDFTSVGVSYSYAWR
jgi:hypothetical protein